ncbi:Translation factor guf1 mitochondrial [Malassezia sp. CBS 17886]|nr:Translation factor guf1 mitochondrial [Malassezia sp. CBS 17886]
MAAPQTLRAALAGVQCLGQGVRFAQRITARCAPLRTALCSREHAWRRTRPLHTSARLRQRTPGIAYDALETRTFSIIAHIDHGKSTLADRLLERTGTIPSDGSAKQFLDKLKVERERGITVKSQAVCMLYGGRRPEDAMAQSSPPVLLNLIDTPGHVDFAYEVRRSLSVCQSALLVIDATQGIQAQTISVFNIARECGVAMIPVLNKVDLPASDAQRCCAQLQDILGLDMSDPRNEPILVSAKTGAGVDDVLAALVARTPTAGGPPETRGVEGFRGFVFDAWYDQYRGVIALVHIVDGAVRKGDVIVSGHTRKRHEVLDLGVNHPEPTPTSILRRGQVGWIITNMKDLEEASLGDTFFRHGEKVEMLPGFQMAAPAVYAGIYPTDKQEFRRLEDAIHRLVVNDRSIAMQRESTNALGQGYRLGFLGTLHLDVFRQRLEDEYGHEILVTTPTVSYRMTRRDGHRSLLSNAAQFPDEGLKKTHYADVEEPYVLASLVFPDEYTGAMMELCAEHRGEQLDMDFSTAGAAQVHMRYRLPLAEVVTDFFDKLKSRSSGFASFDYEPDGFRPSDVVKLSIRVAGAPVEALDIVLHRSKAEDVGRAWVHRLKELLPRQQFEIKIQAAVSSKIVASGTLGAYRKDVTAGLYGGHYERKQKHLNKQKEGKKKLKQLSIGRVRVPQEVYMNLLSARR